jgi:hypothetical protein
MRQIAEFLIAEFGDEIVGTSLNDQTDKIEIALEQTGNNLEITGQFIDEVSDYIFEILLEES